MKAVQYHTQNKHLLLYVERFLKAEVQLPDGSIRKNTVKGTPQGGVISPLLANIFLDIVFDKWMDKHYPDTPFERYADDIVIHCQNFKEALRLLEAIKCRLRQCKLAAHRDKTKIVYCKRNQKYHPPFEIKYCSFDFLGFTFKTKRTRAKWGHLQLVFTPSMSNKAVKRVSDRLKELKVHRWVGMNIRQVSEKLAPQIRGWLHYFGRFNKTGLKRAMRLLHFRLLKWVINKYRRFRRKPRILAWNWLRKVCQDYPLLFEHWKYGFHP